MSMKLEHQVASLDLSKKLRDLGVAQDEAQFYRGNCNGERILESRDFWWHRLGPDNFDQYAGKQLIAAFTVAELGVMLPGAGWHSHFTIKKEGTLTSGEKFGWICIDDKFIDEPNKFYADTEANARAKMLIYLLEQKIVTVEEVNARMAA